MDFSLWLVGRRSTGVASPVTEICYRPTSVRRSSPIFGTDADTGARDRDVDHCARGPATPTDGVTQDPSSNEVVDRIVSVVTPSTVLTSRSTALSTARPARRRLLENERPRLRRVDDAVWEPITTSYRGVPVFEDSFPFTDPQDVCSLVVDVAEDERRVRDGPGPEFLGHEGTEGSHVHRITSSAFVTVDLRTGLPNEQLYGTEVVRRPATTVRWTRVILSTSAPLATGSWLVRVSAATTTPLLTVRATNVPAPDTTTVGRVIRFGPYARVRVETSRRPSHDIRRPHPVRREPLQ